jgi:hypothetical protein
MSSARRCCEEADLGHGGGDVWAGDRSGAGPASSDDLVAIGPDDDDGDDPDEGVGAVDSAGVAARLGAQMGALGSEGGAEVVGHGSSASSVRGME